ncbi:spermatogenesis-associated protein 20 [Cylas formicarius]|uniref:spermatogenesis-associated protein 20 n=1 Tax=Cylas formicarius TaxID=197179 RepID=UPI002958DF66|nr:spermatogenesis-associated protein 20 [Cylas formicarius]
MIFRAVLNFSSLSGAIRRFASCTKCPVSASSHFAGVLRHEVESRGPIYRPLRFVNFRNQCLNMSGAGTSTDSGGKKVNRLASERSPYLLQHATNPVDWYPWGDEAFEKAKAEDKPIFLSVGYSTCHWCHVMEKESFENESVAKIMNEHFVNIKVDREERPDVDKMYMSFIQATVGGGGWPMSVFLTPDLEPLAGGTYFPPEDSKYGQPGFKTVLTNIAEQWKTNKATILKSGKHCVEILRRISESERRDASSVADVPGEDCWKKCALQLSRSYEADYGGFSMAPKFPQPSNFNFLFHMYWKEKNTERGFQCLEMCLHTLKRMAYGGIHDHVGKGFARYSVDERWHVPHFEKMLYDQAQLAVSYCDAYVVTKDEFYAEVARDILTYVSRDLSHQMGGFYGAQDADSYPEAGAPRKREGAFCVWENDEIVRLLGDKETSGLKHSDVVAHHYGVKPDGNVKRSQDPHGELRSKNVLACFGSYESTASNFNITVDAVKTILDEAHATLYEERRRRPAPDTDTKIVTSWNGLMVSGFAKAGFVLKNQSYIDRAIRAADFVRRFLYDEERGTLLRCCYGDGAGVAQTTHPVDGFLDDYAFLIRGLLDLYEASLDADWLQWAETLQERQDELFWDAQRDGYFTSPEGDASVLIRRKDDQDGAEPCGNSVAVHNLIRLANYLHRDDMREKAGKTLACFSERLKAMPLALPEMTSALMLYHNSATQVFIAGHTEDNHTQALLDVVRASFIPGRILAVADGPGGRAGLLYQRLETLSRLRPIGGKPAAYVCRNFTCSLPVTEPDELATSLDNEEV